MTNNPQTTYKETLHMNETCKENAKNFTQTTITFKQKEASEMKASPKDQLLYSLTAIIIQLLEEKKSSVDTYTTDLVSAILGGAQDTETVRLDTVIAELNKLVQACAGEKTTIKRRREMWAEGRKLQLPVKK